MRNKFLSITIYLIACWILAGTFSSCGPSESQKPLKQVTIEYPNGQIKEVYFLSPEGLKEGKQISYDSLGNVDEEINYKSGLREGPQKAFYPSKKTWCSGHNSNGMRKGKVRCYYESGNLHFEENYNNDTLQGPYFVYHQNGNLKWLGNLKNGIYDKFWIGWNEDKINTILLYYRGGCSNPPCLRYRAFLNFQTGKIIGQDANMFGNYDPFMRNLIDTLTLPAGYSISPEIKAFYEKKELP